MRLVSFYGNEVVYTDDERKIKRLKEQGYKEQELKVPETKKELPKRKGEQKKNGRKRKLESEGNI